MMRVLGSLLFAVGADGVRMKRAREGAKFVAGVPILNYYDGSSKSGLAETSADEDWVLVVKPGVTDEEIHTLCQKSKCLREGHPSKGGIPYFEVRATEGQLTDLLKASSSFLKFVERDAQIRMIPDMPVSTASSASWGLDKVGAPTRPSQGAGVHVYVLDTGLRVTHNDYGGRAISALDMSSGEKNVCNGALTCAEDNQGHGSHCAGTAAGTTYGVAPEASIHGIKVLSDSGGGEFSWSFEALDWMVTDGQFPAVASMSLGGEVVLAAMEVAVDAAVTGGVVVVVAGGNSNADACNFSPAFIQSAITVGSTDSQNRRSSFSNYGVCTQIWAPGSDIISVSVSSDTAQKSSSGTSMACPHVSGAAALVLEANPSFGASAVLNTLLDRSVRDAISGLKDGDVNALLWVGAGEPPVYEAPPTPVCPEKCNTYCTWRYECTNAGCC